MAISTPAAQIRRLPEMGRAVGFIALYFMLQLIVANLLLYIIDLSISRPFSRAAAVLRTAVAASPSQADTRVLLVIITLAITASVTLWLVYRYCSAMWHQGTPPGLGFAPAAPVYLILAAFTGVFLPILGGYLTEWLAHGRQVTQGIKQLGAGSSLVLRLLLAMMATTVAPLVEETLFRGLLFSALLRQVRLGWAMGLSAMVFGLVHLPDLNYQWYAIPDLALLGMALAWLRWCSSSLWPSILAHGVNNLLAALVWFGVDVSARH